MLIDYQSRVRRLGAALPWYSAFAIRFAVGFALHLSASLTCAAFVPLVDVFTGDPPATGLLAMAHYILMFPTIIFATDPWQSTGVDVVIDSLFGGMCIATVWQLVARGRRRLFYD